MTAPEGRELDAEVAQKVMGLKVEILPIMPDEDYEGMIPRFSTAEWEKEMREDPETTDFQRESWDSEKGPVVIEGNERKYVVPAYSTDIAAVWDVVEKLKRKLIDIRIEWDGEDGCWAIYSALRGGSLLAVASDFPLAICKASLKAMRA